MSLERAERKIMHLRGKATNEETYEILDILEEMIAEMKKMRSREMEVKSKEMVMSRNKEVEVEL